MKGRIIKPAFQIGQRARPAAPVEAAYPNRRLRVDALCLALFSGAALLSLFRPGPAGPPPPPLAELPAVYRPDGGQRLSREGVYPPNALTRLNLGRRVDLAAAPVRLLAALPGLGPKTAAKARASGCLPARGRSGPSGLLEEAACGRNSP